MTDVRTLREVVRGCEARLGELTLDNHEPPRDPWGPGWEAWWHVRKARSALRSADKVMAKADDPRLPVLAPLKRLVSRRSAK